MRQHVRHAAVAATLAAVLGAAFVARAASSAPSRSTIELVATFDEKTLVTDDVAPTGRSVGDQITFTADITRAGKPAGRAEFLDIAIDDIAIDERIEDVLRDLFGGPASSTSPPEPGRPLRLRALPAAGRRT